MNRYEQRRDKFLQYPEVAEGYREMAADIYFMQVIETTCSKLEISKEHLVSLIEKKRTSRA